MNIDLPFLGARPYSRSGEIIRRFQAAKGSHPSPVICEICGPIPSAVRKSVLRAPGARAIVARRTAGTREHEQAADDRHGVAAHRHDRHQCKDQPHHVAKAPLSAKRLVDDVRVLNARNHQRRNQHGKKGQNPLDRMVDGRGVGQRVTLTPQLVEQNPEAGNRSRRRRRRQPAEIQVILVGANLDVEPGQAQRGKPQTKRR